MEAKSINLKKAQNEAYVGSLTILQQSIVSNLPSYHGPLTYGLIYIYIYMLRA